MNSGIGHSMNGSTIKHDSKHSLFFFMPKYVYFIGDEVSVANDGKPELRCRAFYPAADLFEEMKNGVLCHLCFTKYC
jgi:hypothetical protein